MSPGDVLARLVDLRLVADADAFLFLAVRLVLDRCFPLSGRTPGASRTSLPGLSIPLCLLYGLHLCGVRTFQSTGFCCLLDAFTGKDITQYIDAASEGNVSEGFCSAFYHRFGDLSKTTKQTAETVARLSISSLPRTSSEHGHAAAMLLVEIVVYIRIA